MKLSEIVLVTHVAIATITVISGTFSIVFKKAGAYHRYAGKVYFYGIIFTALSAFVLMTFPVHTNPIMIFIGIFMLYLALTGYRSLKLKSVFTPNDISNVDKAISTIMGITAIGMVLFGLYTFRIGDIWGLPLITYGILGGINVFDDFKMFKSVGTVGHAWLKFHASKMIGSYIGALTAVIVTQYHHILGVYSWFVTMVLGLIYMFYWIRKIKLNPASIYDLKT